MEYLLADPRRILPGLPKTQTAQAGQKFAGWGRPHLGPGIPRCSASTRDGAKGVERGSRLPKPGGDALPTPTQPRKLPKGKWGGEAEAASLVQRPWAAALKDGTFGGLFTSGDTSQHSPSAWSLLPKGGAVPLRDSGLLPPTPRQVTMPAEGRWVFPRTLSQSL